MSTIQMTDVHFMAAHEAAVPLCKACKHASKRQTTLLPVFDVHQTAIRVPKSLMCNAHAGWSVLQHWRLVVVGNEAVAAALTHQQSFTRRQGCCA